MKWMLLVCSVLLSFVVSADQTAVKACDTLKNRGLNYSAERCYQATEGQYLDQNADSVCDRMAGSGYGDGAVRCLKVSVNKAFQAEGTSFCEKLVDHRMIFTALDCMNLIGNKAVEQGFGEACMQAVRKHRGEEVQKCLRSSL